MIVILVESAAEFEDWPSGARASDDRLYDSPACAGHSLPRNRIVNLERQPDGSWKMAGPA